MNKEATQSRYLISTVVALVIAILFYPMTFAATEEYSIGEILGLGPLVIAVGLSWRAFTLNIVSSRIRRWIQLPVTTLVTFMVILNAYCLIVSKWWWAF